MWCPSVSLSVWANAWLAGQAAPDDVLDSLTQWAPTQSVIAYDAVSAGHTGLPFPDVDGGGTVSLLQTIRTAAGRPAPATAATIELVLPVPGDVRGLTPGTPFQRDAVAAGEALIITDRDHPATAIGLVPEHDDQTAAVHWTVYSLSDPPVGDHQELGEGEYALRSAVRSAAAVLGTLGLESPGADDPRELVEQVLDSSRQHRIPDHAPPRAVRVLELAAHVDAILAVSAELLPIPTLSSSQTRITDETLRPLAAVVRTARMAAISTILQSAWRA